MNKFTNRKKNKLNKKVKTRKQIGNKATLLASVGMREKTDAEKTPRYIEKKIVKGGSIKVKPQEAQDPVTKSVTDNSDKVTKSVTDNSDKVTKSVTDNSDKVTKSVTDTANNVTKSVNDTTNNVTESVTDTADKVTESVTDTADKVTESVNSYAKTINGFIKGAANAFNGVVGSTKSEQDATLNIALNIAKDPRIKAIIEQTSGDIAKGLALSGQKILTNAAQEIPGAGAVIALGKIADNIGESSRNISEIATKTTNDFNNVMDEINNKPNILKTNMIINQPTIGNNTNLTNDQHELDKKKSDSANILKQTNESKNDFNKSKVQAGGQQTRKNWFPNKHTTTKRVRFDI